MLDQTCRSCREDRFDFDFVMAFQPIVDLREMCVWGYEALVRGPGSTSAASVLASVNDRNRYHFDQACRVKAIETAGRLFPGPDLRLSINFLPNAVYKPSACIRTSLAAAERVGFARENIMFEFTEGEKVDPAKLTHIIDEYRRFGFKTAIDDFGAGYSGLNLLAAFQPDIVKLDMALIRDIDLNRPRQIIVGAIMRIARELGVEVLAEGVETERELRALRDFDIRLFQGYYFARPATESLPPVPGLKTEPAATAA